ncbi:hypothetical protein [Endozoicomonas atrinae]|uniref:hypothetical protein n=1 Tax=Endozoicomonas atrinae TaxID=1333660 RepID=UPI003B004013
MKRWQNNIPEYLISPLTTGFRKISIGVVKDRKTEAEAMSDNEAAEQLQRARQTLFKSVHERQAEA